MKKFKYFFEILYTCLALMFISKQVANGDTVISDDLRKCGVLLNN